ncbi:hypothetical protein SBF1_860012 [Candidatus Desulfosporosinus infrequens]|uniref:Uncharacterized protein n=1 Tax=Candidatus Desulfosporosinus infrequens TaxID=2043169 RepID=A0A2U3LV05_9FIRM|nr:hypothetical protein SBF1_860012 [Candidatus Desulfosporosinus infrequens]
MVQFTDHELEIIEVALVRYMKTLESGIFAERERARIQVILEKIDLFPEVKETPQSPAISLDPTTRRPLL